MSAQGRVFKLSFAAQKRANSSKVTGKRGELRRGRFTVEAYLFP